MKLTGFTLVLIFAALTIQAEDRFTCPVTKPTLVRFEPTGAFAGRQVDLFGSEKLFTLFRGNWQTVQRTERGLRVPKIVWGSEVVDLSTEIKRSSLKITGRRLDGEAGSFQFGGASTAWVDKGFFVTLEFFVPALGCWEVTGHFHGAILTVVVDLK